MADGAQLYAPVRAGRRAARSTWCWAPTTPASPTPPTAPGATHLAALALDWQPGPPVPEPAYTDVEHDVWRMSRPRPRAPAPPPRLPRLPGGQGGAGAARATVSPSCPRSPSRLPPATGFTLPAGGRPGAAPRLLRRLRRLGLLLDPVPAPPVAAPLHARARRGPRGRGPRQPAGRPGFAALYRLVGEAVGRTRTARRRCASCPGCSGSRWSSAW